MNDRFGSRSPHAKVIQTIQSLQRIEFGHMSDRANNELMIGKPTPSDSEQVLAGFAKGTKWHNNRSAVNNCELMRLSATSRLGDSTKTRAAHVAAIQTAEKNCRISL